MNASPTISAATAAEIETRILSNEATRGDILDLYQFYFKKNDTLNRKRVADIIQNTSPDAGTKPLFIYYGVPDIKISDAKYECYVDESGFTGTAKIDLGTICNLLCLPSVKEVFCVKKVATTCPGTVETIAKLCRTLGKRLINMADRDVEIEKFLTSLAALQRESFQKRLHLPSEITIPTVRGQCNIKCRFCEQAFLDTPYQEVDKHIFEQALRVIPKAFIKTIMTPYLEPLVSKSYLENYLKRALELRPDINIGINTNGSHLTGEIAAKLVDWQLKYINISMNLCDRESYLRFSGRDFFERVCEGVRLLHAERLKKQSRYPQIIVQFLNIPPVTGNEDALRTYWGQWADSVYFRNVSVPSALPDRVEKMKQELGEEFMTSQVERPRGWPCMSLFSTCAIDYAGNYLPCCPGKRAAATATTEAEEALAESLIIGNIFEEDIAAVWQGKRLQRIRAMQVADLLPVCTACRMNQTGCKDLLALRNAFYAHYYGEGKF